MTLKGLWKASGEAWEVSVPGSCWDTERHDAWYGRQAPAGCAPITLGVLNEGQGEDLASMCSLWIGSRFPMHASALLEGLRWAIDFRPEKSFGWELLCSEWRA